MSTMWTFVCLVSKQKKCLKSKQKCSDFRHKSVWNRNKSVQILDTFWRKKRVWKPNCYWVSEIHTSSDFRHLLYNKMSKKLFSLYSKLNSVLNRIKNWNILSIAIIFRLYSSAPKSECLKSGECRNQKIYLFRYRTLILVLKPNIFIWFLDEKLA